MIRLNWLFSLSSSLVLVLLLTSFCYGINFNFPKDNLIFSSRYSTLDDMITAAGSKAAFLIVEDTITANGGVHIPSHLSIWMNRAGEIQHDSILVDSSSIDGCFGTLRATCSDTSVAAYAVVLRGHDVVLKNVNIIGFDTTTLSFDDLVRKSNAASSIIWVDSAFDYTVENCHLQYSASTAFIFYDALSGNIKNNFADDTKADMIHLTARSCKNIVDGNHLTNSGDDFLAIISLVANGTMCCDNEIINNICDSGLGGGMKVSGGKNNSFDKNRINNTVYAGITIVSEGSYVTDSVIDNTVTNSYLSNVGKSDGSNYPILVYGRSGYPNINTTIEGGYVKNSRNGGMNLGNTINNTENVTVKDISFETNGGTSGSGIILGGAKNVRVNDCSFRIFSGGGVVSASGYGGGFLDLCGNSFDSINTSATGSIDCILLNGTLYDVAYIDKVTLLNTPVLEHFVEATSFSGDLCFGQNEEAGNDYSYDAATCDMWGLDSLQANFIIVDTVQADIIIADTMNAKDININLDAGVTTGKGIYIDGQNDGFMHFYNISSSSNEFAGGLKSKTSVASQPGFFIAGIPAADDANSPCIRMRGAKPTYDGAATTSKLLEVQNWQTTMFRISTGGSAQLNGNLYLRYAGADGDQYIYFYEGSSTTGASLKWDNAINGFTFSHNLTFPDTLTLSFPIVVDIDDTYDYPFRMFRKAITLIKVSGVCVGGTNVVGCLMEYDADGANPVTCESDGDWTFTTGEEEITTGTDLDNPSIDANDYLGWKTTSVSGSVGFFILTVEYTVD
jgi:parallel beta helix pectate lyase-like protein